MRCLLDTHVLIWSIAHSLRLPPALRASLADPAHEVFYSAASIWEAAIKHGLRRADFTMPPATLEQAARETGFVELPITSAVACLVAELPLHHRDPFDRLLIAQAMWSGLTLHTADPQLSRYGRFVRQLA